MCAFLAARAKDDGFVAHLGGSVTLILPTHRSEPSSTQSYCRVPQTAPGTRSKRVEDKGKNELGKGKKSFRHVHLIGFSVCVGGDINVDVFFGGVNHLMPFRLIRHLLLVLLGGGAGFICMLCLSSVRSVMPCKIAARLRRKMNLYT